MLLSSSTQVEVGGNLVVTHPAFCVACSRYILLELPTLKDAQEIPGKRCPICREGSLVHVYPPGYSEEITKEAHYTHKTLPITAYRYIYDHVDHFIYVIADEYVFIAGYDGSKWAFCLPEQPIESSGYKVRWDEFTLVVDDEVVFSPRDMINQS